MENSHIEWTDHTFNPWIGCTIFMKQLGKTPGFLDSDTAFQYFPIKDAKGGDWNEWPEDLRLRQFPVPSVP